MGAAMHCLVWLHFLPRLQPTRRGYQYLCLELERRHPSVHRAAYPSIPFLRQKDRYGINAYRDEDAQESASSQAPILYYRGRPTNLKESRRTLIRGIIPAPQAGIRLSELPLWWVHASHHLRCRPLSLGHFFCLPQLSHWLW